MVNSFFAQRLRIIGRELSLNCSWVVVIFLLITFFVLGVGTRWPHFYESSVLLASRNIETLRPLLMDSEEKAGGKRSTLLELREQIYRGSFLMEVAVSTGLIHADQPEARTREVMAKLRSRIILSDARKGRVRISYSDEKLDMTLKVLTSVVDALIENSVSNRWEASFPALNLVDRQIEAYKKQLSSSEERFKEFESRDLDFAAQSLTNDINLMRRKINAARSGIEEKEVKRDVLERRLQNAIRSGEENKKRVEQQKKLGALVEELENMRQAYQRMNNSDNASASDASEIKQKIESLSGLIESMRSDVLMQDKRDADDENLSVEQLNELLAMTERELMDHRKQLEVMQQALKEQIQQSTEIAGQKKQLDEAAREYRITKGIYEDLLERREKMRLSVALDVEAQKARYQVVEPAGPPQLAPGIHFIHFVIAAPVIGLLSALAAVILWVFIDQRVRSPDVLSRVAPSTCEVLAVIPGYITPLSRRGARSKLLFLIVTLALFSLLYLFVVYGYQIGYEEVYKRLVEKL